MKDTIEFSTELVTVSYNLPRNMVETLRNLARKESDDVRKARAAGDYSRGDARTSASKIVLDALLPHLPEWEARLSGKTPAPKPADDITPEERALIYALRAVQANPLKMQPEVDAERGAA